MKKRILAFIMAFTFVTGVSGCGDASETSSDSSQTEATSDAADSQGEEAAEELKEVRFGIAGTEDTSLMMELAAVAYKEGYFEEELNEKGYTLTASFFAGAGPEINEAIAAEEIDIAAYGDFPIFTSNSNGIETTVIASVNSEIQYAMFTTSDEITEAKDLEGKRVVVPVGTVTQYFWERYVEANDLDLSKIEVINSTDFTSLLISGEADAAATTVYGAYALIDMGIGTIFDTSENMDDGTSSQLVAVRTEYLEENPDVAVAFNKALIKAYETVLENPQTLYDDEATPNISAEAWEKVYSYDTSFEYLTPEITEEEVAYWENLNNWMYDNSVITSKVDVENLYDTSYYEQAAAELEEE